MKLLAAVAVLGLAVEAAQVTVDTLLAESRPEMVDYYALKSQLGARRVVELRAEVTATLQKRGVGYLGPACLSEPQAKVLTGLFLAARSESGEAFRRDRAEGEALLAEMRRDWTQLKAGGPAPAHYQGAASWLRRAQGTTDPRLGELYGRLARDQFVRSPHPRRVRNGPGGIADLPAFYASQVLAAEWCEADRDNTEWLKGQLKQHGWFNISRYGEDADTAAFLIVQHADRDRAFQRDMLNMLEKLAAEKETSPRTYAYLYDRLASADKRPQRFGTQGSCTGPGTWEPNALEDPAKVDEFRASVGMGPLAEYVAGFKSRCP